MPPKKANPKKPLSQETIVDSDGDSVPEVEAAGPSTNPPGGEPLTKRQQKAKNQADKEANPPRKRKRPVKPRKSTKKQAPTADEADSQHGTDADSQDGSAASTPEKSPPPKRHRISKSVDKDKDGEGRGSGTRNAWVPPKHITENPKRSKKKVALTGAKIGHCGFPASDYREPPEWTNDKRSGGGRSVNAVYVFDYKNVYRQHPWLLDTPPRWHNRKFHRNDEQRDKEPKPTAAQLGKMRADRASAADYSFLSYYANFTNPFSMMTAMDTFGADIGELCMRLYADSWENADKTPTNREVIVTLQNMRKGEYPALLALLSRKDTSMKRVTKGMTWGHAQYQDSESNAGEDPCATGNILHTALLWLRLCPTEMLKDDVELTDDIDAYEHHFLPSDDPRAIVGFTLEDWYRAVLLVTFNNVRRSGRMKVCPENIPMTKVNARVFYAQEGDEANIVQEEEAITKASNMTNRYMFTVAGKLTESRGALAETVRSSVRFMNDRDLSERTVNAHDKVISTMQGSVNITKVVKQNLTKLKIPIDSADDTTTLELIAHMRKELEFAPTLGTDTSHTLKALNPELDVKEFTEFLQVGCHDLYDNVKKSQDGKLTQTEALKVDVELSRAYETYSLNKTIYAIEPDADSEDLAKTADVMGFESWQNMSLNPSMPNFKAYPAQAVDADWMWRQEQRPWSGSILANAVGTGKTLTMLLMVWYAHCKCLKEREEDPEGTANKRYYPTLIVAPMTNFGQLWQKAQAVADRLTLKIFYGDKINASKKDGRSQSTISSRELDSWLYANADPKNIETSKIVIFTTPNTATRRLMHQVHEGIRFTDRKYGRQIKRAALGKVAHEHTGKIHKCDLWNGRPVVNVDYIEEDKYVVETESEKIDVYIPQWKLKSFVNGYNRIWQRIIFDEAQMAKKPGGIIINWLTREFSYARHLVSATLIVNHLKDLTNPLQLFWRQCWNGMSYLDVWHLPSRDQLGDTILLYDPNYDPHVQLWHKGTESVMGIFHKDNYLNSQLPTGTKYLMDVFDKQGDRLWILHPALYKVTGAMYSWRNEFPVKVVKPLLELLSRKRTMHTKMVLPDGSSSFPAQNLKSASIEVEELEYPKEVRNDVLDKTTTMLRGGRLGDTDAPNSARDSSGIRVPRTGEDTPGRMNANMRAAVLYGFDLHNEVMMKPDATIASIPDNIFEEKMASYASKHAEGKRTVATRDKQQNDYDPPSARKKKAIMLGREHIDNLVASDPFCGLLYMFRLYYDKYAPEPYDRYQMVKWCVSRSPMMLRTLELVHHWRRVVPKEQRSKVFILAEVPHQQNQCATLLERAGFNVLSLRSIHNEAERSHAASEFNDVNSDVDVLIVTYYLGAEGLDLHTACCYGIALAFPWSSSKLNQAMGRLIRLGQTKHVTWKVLKVKGTVGDYMERVCISKWADELSATGNTPSHIKHWVRYAVVYEVIRNYLHQPFNRLAWADETFGTTQLDQYHSAQTERRGHFYTFIAVLARSLNEKDYEILFDKWSYILPEVADKFVGSFMKEVPLTSSYEEVSDLGILTKENLLNIGKQVNSEWEKSSEQVRASKRTAKLLEARLQERDAILAQYRQEDEALGVEDIEYDMNTFEEKRGVFSFSVNDLLQELGDVRKNSDIDADIDFFKGLEPQPDAPPVIEVPGSPTLKVAAAARRNAESQSSNMYGDSDAERTMEVMANAPGEHDEDVVMTDLDPPSPTPAQSLEENEEAEVLQLRHSSPMPGVDDVLDVPLGHSSPLGIFDRDSLSPSRRIDSILDMTKKRHDRLIFESDSSQDNNTDDGDGSQMDVDDESDKGRNIGKDDQPAKNTAKPSVYDSQDFDQFWSKRGFLLVAR
ncbi:hypothetical protein CLIM01_12137 [Colletotrichum limetticola]|uniref:Helicase C-terminal domain-containing protein n=1 Tax=Colletotrichum limetticola TaxID=1209924 RepID=A0ABQ9PEU4_9PEZI|nr:hypothetical protein CLIM01_12137 [Colletotrichum limetticola]